MLISIQSTIPLYGDTDDGDTISCKPIFTIEANKDAEDRINSKGYYLNVAGNLMRGIDRDFVLTAYNLTITDEELSDANKTKPMYVA